MIGRNSRDRLAFALRQLASGLITNDEFDDAAFEIPIADDAALRELSTFGWLYYSDLSTYRLKGRHAHSREARTSIARVVLFLKTDQEYVHGDFMVNATRLGKPFLRGPVIALTIAAGAGLYTHLALSAFWLGFGLVIAFTYLGYLFMRAAREMDARQRKQEQGALEDTFCPFTGASAASEQFRYWPFADRHAYELALANPPFLCGRVSTAT